MIGSENMLNDQINSINNMIEKVSMFKSCLEHAAVRVARQGNFDLLIH